MVDVSRSTVSHVGDKHAAGILIQSSQQLSVQIAELRSQLNNAQQLNFEPQLEHSEDLINALDHQLQEVAQKIRSGHSIQTSSPTMNSERASRSLRQQCRLLNSAIAQMISASHAAERRQVGMAALEIVQALGDFTDSIEDVAATKQQGMDTKSMETLILNARSVIHESGRVFQRVRERTSSPLLEEAGRKVTEELRKTLASLPDNVHFDQAVSEI